MNYVLPKKVSINSDNVFSSLFIWSELVHFYETEQFYAL